MAKKKQWFKKSDSTVIWSTSTFGNIAGSAVESLQPRAEVPQRSQMSQTQHTSKPSSSYQNFASKIGSHIADHSSRNQFPEPRKPQGQGMTTVPKSRSSPTKPSTANKPNTVNKPQNAGNTVVKSSKSVSKLSQVSEKQQKTALLEQQLSPSEPESGTWYTLESKDGKKIRISEEALQHSDFLKGMLFALTLLDEPIPIGQVDGTNLELAVKWCEHHRKEPPMETVNTSEDIKIPRWDREFLDIDGDDLVLLMRAADFLAIRQLYCFICKLVAEMLNNKCQEEMRASYRLMGMHTASFLVRKKNNEPIVDLECESPYIMQNLATFGLRKVKHLLRDILYYIKTPELAKMCRHSKDFREMAATAGITVSFSSLTEEEKDDLRVQTIIDILHLEHMRDPKTFKENSNVTIGFERTMMLRITWNHSFYFSFCQALPESFEKCKGVRELVRLDDDANQILFVKERPRRFKFKQGPLQEVEQLTLYFKDTFGFPSVAVEAFLRYNPNKWSLLQSIVHTIKRHNWKVEEARFLCLEEPGSSECLEHFLSRITPDRTTISGKCDIKLRVQIPSREIVWQRANWVTLQDLLEMDGSILRIYNSNFSAIDISHYLNHWCSSEQFKNPERVGINVKVPVT